MRKPSRDRVTAFVLCGGLGTRLRSAVSGQPKSMAAVGGVPFLQLLIEQLGQQGVRNVVLATGYLAEQIEEYFGRGGRFGLDIRYSREEKALGTAGALKLAEGQMSDPALILNGDGYGDWNLAAMLRTYKAKGATTVIALHEVLRSLVTEASPSGMMAASCSLSRKEPGMALASSTQASIWCRRNSSAICPQDNLFLWRRTFFLNSPPAKSMVFSVRGLFIDIGIPSDLLRAQTLLRRGPS